MAWEDRLQGEVASSMAIRTLVSLVLHTPDWILGNYEHQSDDDAAEKRLKKP